VKDGGQIVNRFGKGAVVALMGSMVFFPIQSRADPRHTMPSSREPYETAGMALTRLMDAVHVRIESVSELNADLFHPLGLADAEDGALPDSIAGILASMRDEFSPVDPSAILICPKMLVHDRVVISAADSTVDLWICPTHKQWLLLNAAGQAWMRLKAVPEELARQANGGVSDEASTDSGRGTGGGRR